MKGILLSLVVAMSFAGVGANAAQGIGIATFGDSTAGTDCTSSPCTVYSHNGWVSSVTRNGTGDYTVNISMGAYTGKPTCVCSANSIANAGPESCAISPSGSSSAVSLTTSYNNSPNEAYVEIMCYE